MSISQIEIPSLDTILPQNLTSHYSFDNNQNQNQNQNRIKSYQSKQSIEQTPKVINTSTHQHRNQYKQTKDITKKTKNYKLTNTHQQLNKPTMNINMTSATSLQPTYYQSKNQTSTKSVRHSRSTHPPSPYLANRPLVSTSLSSSPFSLPPLGWVHPLSQYGTIPTCTCIVIL